MQTLTKNNVSIYIFDDKKLIQITDEKTIVGDPVELIILDCKAPEVELHKSVIAPEDWEGHKYLFDGEVWTPNPDFSSPKSEPV